MSDAVNELLNSTESSPDVSKLPRPLYYGRLEFIRDKPGLAIPLLIILVITSMVGTFGNVLTITVIATRKHLRNVMCIFMVNLAISDLYVTTFADPFSFVAKVEGEEFFDNLPGLCQTIASFCTISCVGSLMTIGLMSINRYMYICNHEIYARVFTTPKCVCMCISVYFVGGFLVLLNAAGIGDHGYDRKSIECIWDRMATPAYTVVFSITLVWIPSLMITFCYLRIFLFVRAHSRRMRDHNQMGVSSTLKTNFHLAKTLCIIFAVFVTCWAPYALILVTDTEDDYPLEAHVIIVVFAHIHPSTNWIIYYYTNKRFASAVRELLFNNRLFRSCYLARKSKKTKITTSETRDKNSSMFPSETSMQVRKPPIHKFEHSFNTKSSDL